MRKSIIVIALAALAFVSCDTKKSGAKGMIKDFTKEYMVDVDDYRMYIERIDSTRHVGKDKVMQMRQTGGPAGVYKKGVQYEAGDIPKTLTYVNVLFTHKSDSNKTHKQTFYFDQEMTRIVANK